MRVYFLRHGQAVARTDWSGDDRDRPLTETGVELMRREAEAIKRLDLAPDIIVTSPWLRAAQTAEIVAAHLDMRSRLLRDARLAPGFDAGKLEKVLQENEMAAAVLLVGHEPDLSETVSELVGGGRIVVKKGGLLRVDLPDHSVRRGELVWLIPPPALTR